MQRMKTCLSSALFAGLLCAGLTLGTNASAAGTGPCAEDISKYCPDVKPGGGAIIECLEKHESELTDPCKAHEAKMHGKRGERKEMVQERIKFRQACGNDINKYCPGVAPGSGRIAICLTEHDKDLSASCSEILKSMKLPKE